MSSAQSDDEHDVWLNSDLEDSDDDDTCKFVLPLNIKFLSVDSSDCVAHLLAKDAADIEVIGKVLCTIGLLVDFVAVALKSTDEAPPFGDFTFVEDDDDDVEVADEFARKNFNLSSIKLDEVFRILSLLH